MELVPSNSNPNVKIPLVKLTSMLATGEWSLLAAFSLLLALLTTGAGIFTYQKSRIFLHNAKAAKAEVVQVESGLAVLQYSVDGNSFEYKMDAPRPDMAQGDTTTVYFNEENPSEVRDVLSSQIPTSTVSLSCAASLFWFGFGLLSFISLQSTRQSVGASKSHVVETACVFIALEGTHERAQSARLIRLVCRWVHPETGQEWLLRSTTLHPAQLPMNLEVGATLPCRVDFDNPSFHEIQVA